jgi:hypothetical protein
MWLLFCALALARLATRDYDEADTESKRLLCPPLRLDVVEAIRNATFFSVRRERHATRMFLKLV